MLSLKVPAVWLLWRFFPVFTCRCVNIFQISNISPAKRPYDGQFSANMRQESYACAVRPSSRDIRGPYVCCTENTGARKCRLTSPHRPGRIPIDHLGLAGDLPLICDLQQTIEPLLHCGPRARPTAHPVPPPRRESPDHRVDTDIVANFTHWPRSRGGSRDAPYLPDLNGSDFSDVGRAVC